jgi:hypothetical protein
MTVHRNATPLQDRLRSRGIGMIVMRVVSNQNRIAGLVAKAFDVKLPIASIRMTPASSISQKLQGA